MQGSDLVNRLLLRFRKKPIALVTIIVAMFYQIKVDPNDKESLRLRWLKSTPHCMNVTLLSATLSPCCSMFSPCQTAIDFHFTTDAKDVVLAVQNNFYIDDFLSSVHDSKSGQKLNNDIKFF